MKRMIQFGAFLLALASVAQAEPSYRSQTPLEVLQTRNDAWLKVASLRPSLRYLLQGVGTTSVGRTSGGSGGGSGTITAGTTVVTGCTTVVLVVDASSKIQCAPIAGTDLGAAATPFRYLYLYGDGTFGSTSLKLTGTPTGNRVISLQDATQTLAQLGAQTFTGAQRLVDGAANLPAQTFTTGTTTGMWSRAGTTIDWSISGTHYLEFFLNSGVALNIASTGQYTWAAGTPNTTGDTGWSRASAGIIRATTGDPSSVNSALAPTATTATQSNFGEMRSAISAYSWTNAMVVALGATTAGDISMFTLKAKQVVKNAYVIITGAAAGPTTVTVACGRTSSSYIDYIVASDAKAAANTIYGDASGERGTNLTGYDLPSYTGTTTVNCHFISTVSNLSTVTGSTGTLVVELANIP